MTATYRRTYVFLCDGRAPAAPCDQDVASAVCGLPERYRGRLVGVDRSSALSQAEAALAAGEYDEATAAALVSLAGSAERLAQTAADLVDGFVRYLVLHGYDGPTRPGT